MKRLSIRQAILDLIDETDESVGRYPNKLLKWAKYIEKSIGSARGYKSKTLLVTVTGSVIILPSDCYRVLKLYLGDHTAESNLMYKDSSLTTLQIDEVTDENEIYWISEDTTCLDHVFWEEVGDEIHLTSEYDGTELTMLYQYNETDANGDWLVNESHIDAIKKYLMYQLAKIERWKQFKSEKLLRSSHQLMVKDLERDYNIAIRNARALDGEMSEYEKAF